MNEFKLVDECSECNKLNKECKGMQVSVPILSFFCPRFEKKGEKKNG